MSIDAGIELHVGEDDVPPMHSEREPLTYPVMTTAITPGVATSPFLVGLNQLLSPSPGRMWEVLRFAIFGSDDHTVLAGVTAVVYCGPGAGLNAAGDLPSVISAGGNGVTAVPVPYNQVTGHRKVIAQSNDVIYAWCYSAAMPTNQPITLVAYVYDYPTPVRQAMGIGSVRTQ